jgi:hypothetical protein
MRELFRGTVVSVGHSLLGVVVATLLAESHSGTNEEESADAGSEDHPVVELARTVTPPYVSRPDTEMDVFGWSYFLVLAIIFVPFLPFIVLAWLFSKGFEFVAQQTRNEE